MRRWTSSVILVAAGLLGGIPMIADGSVAGGVAVLTAFVLFGVLVSPPAFPRSVTDAEARAAQAVDGRPIIYWRPGCPYCLRLRSSLARRAGRYHWVDIWKDPSAAASVRAVADGNETVPTVITVDSSYVNPSPQLVRNLP
ncbi:glutaredoxin domain-containing protein [Paractinoplanes brasiliensis]|uniref:Glutaredoxin n=1 Tax=Paractinoplanes brasiliensis TaxID=52695 RepID=A0A4R6JT44_9ACTN|nr:glutaredoxin domain-containing protein [Actinoplanes brasiliensis]TDO38601.1 glutaredoxin [Actinoplanes brasiliensis]GID26624.1 membrane protein [Actinoplanes brasiliensis]